MSIQKMMSSYIIIFIFLIGLLSFFKNNQELIKLAMPNSNSSYDLYVMEKMQPYSKDLEKIFINNGFDVTLIQEDKFSAFFEEMYVDIY